MNDIIHLIHALTTDYAALQLLSTCKAWINYRFQLILHDRVHSSRIDDKSKFQWTFIHCDTYHPRMPLFAQLHCTHMTLPIKNNDIPLLPVSLQHLDLWLNLQEHAIIEIRLQRITSLHFRGSKSYSCTISSCVEGPLIIRLIKIQHWEIVIPIQIQHLQFDNNMTIEISSDLLCHQLQTLHVSIDHLPESFCTHFPNLRKLNINRYHSGIRYAIAHAKLEELMIDSTDVANVSNMISYHLKRLHINNLSFGHFTTLELSQYLTHLHLDNGYLMPLNLDQVPHLKHLMLGFYNHQISAWPTGLEYLHLKRYNMHMPILPVTLRTLMLQQFNHVLKLKHLTNLSKLAMYNFDTYRLHLPLSLRCIILPKYKYAIHFHAPLNVLQVPFHAYHTFQDVRSLHTYSSSLRELQCHALEQLTMINHPICEIQAPLLKWFLFKNEKDNTLQLNYLPSSLHYLIATEHVKYSGRLYCPYLKFLALRSDHGIHLTHDKNTKTEPTIIIPKTCHVELVQDQAYKHSKINDMLERYKQVRDEIWFS